MSHSIRQLCSRVKVVCGLPGTVLVSIYANSRIVVFNPDEGMLPAALADVKPFSARRIG